MQVYLQICRICATDPAHQIPHQGHWFVSLSVFGHYWAVLAEYEKVEKKAHQYAPKIKIFWITLPSSPPPITKMGTFAPTALLGRCDPITQFYTRGWHVILVSYHRGDKYHIRFSQTSALICKCMISPWECGYTSPSGKTEASLPHLRAVQNFGFPRPHEESSQIPRAGRGVRSPRQQGSMGFHLLGLCMWRLGYA